MTEPITIHPSGWTATLWHDGQTHVIPNDDLRPHDEWPDCWCAPFLDDDPRGPGRLWVHNSMDGRERYENNGRME